MGNFIWNQIGIVLKNTLNLNYYTITNIIFKQNIYSQEFFTSGSFYSV